MKGLVFGVIALALTVVGAVPVEPCCMVPATYQGSIGQSAQEAVLLHADGREELILKINYHITGAEMPPYFAWVITVPNEPDAYAVADVNLLEQVFAWAEPLIHPPTKGERGDNSHGLPAAAGIELGKRVQVGPYDIQPVRALGQDALEALNAWLAKNGFPTEDPKHMLYFVEHKFTFLCVKIVPPEGKKSVEPAGGLPPLQLSFKSENPYYPLRFSSRQGVFDVNLYVLTRKEFDFAASNDSLRRINWARGLETNIPVAPDSFPAALKDAYGKGVFKGSAEKWFLNVLRTRGVNQGNSIATWAEDIFFRTKA